MTDPLLEIERLRKINRRGRRWGLVATLAAIFFGALWLLQLAWNIWAAQELRDARQEAIQARQEADESAAALQKAKEEVKRLERPLAPPCHPGCFPAGTAIHVVGGTMPIERVHEADIIVTVTPDGTSSQRKVMSVFSTKNRLIEVQTDAGNLVTTETQPLCLADGKLRAAGELKTGDQICRWDDGKRQTATVRSVLVTGRYEQVFNLVVEDLAIFVADGFLARSKPPVEPAP
jgi:hypothetical protein